MTAHAQQSADLAEAAAVRLVPRFRGVMHAYAVVPAIALGIVLIVLAKADRPRVATIAYGSGLSICLGVSAVYHRGRWSARIKAALARLDHSTIFLLIAGTSTPVFLLSVRGSLGTTLVAIEWAGAACGIAIAVLWRRPPAWAEVAPYLILGWLGIVAMPSLFAGMGATGLGLLIGGGALYTGGAVCYALERPDPWPATFGFHEVFHCCVTAAAGAHAVLIAMLVLAA